MERFVCVNGSDNLQIPEAVLREMGIDAPEQIHRDPVSLEKIAGSMEKSGWVRLPFCNTLLAEALGAKPIVSLAGARVKEPAFRNAAELPEALSTGTERLIVMMKALEELSGRGKLVAYGIDGPLGILCALLPMSRVFSTLRKPAGVELLQQAEDWVCAYAAMAVAHGAKILSFADPVATTDILGERMFSGVYVPCLKRLLERLLKEHPQVPIHLCGKLTQCLLDVEACEAELWSASECSTYGQVLAAFCQSGQGGIIGHFCLNFLDAKRSCIKLIKFR